MIADTVFVSPLSTSVSFASTPDAAFLVSVASSFTASVSFTPTGASFAPWIVTVSVAVEVAPAASLTVYVNVSVKVCPLVRRACTVALLLSTV